jgi:hypothetical protein
MTDSHFSLVFMANQNIPQAFSLIWQHAIYMRNLELLKKQRCEGLYHSQAVFLLLSLPMAKISPGGQSSFWAIVFLGNCF